MTIRPRHIFATTTVAVALLAIAGCSSSSPAAVTQIQTGGATVTTAPGTAAATTAKATSTVASPKDETAAAKAMLLTVSDFPTGWAEKPSTSSASNSAFDKCDTATSKARTAKVETGDFSSNGTDSVSEQLVIYTSQDPLVSSFGELQSKFDCFTKAVNGGALDTDKAKFSGATVSPESFPSMGDHSAAYRVAIHAQEKGQTGIGSAIDAYIDVVYVQSGRVGVSIEGFGILSPFDSGMLQTTAQKAVSKVTQP